MRGCVERFKPAEGEWLAVRQWNFSENNLPSAQMRTLREALDAASTKHPIVLLGNDGHHNATNSAGLARAATRDKRRLGLSAKTLQSDFADLQPFVGVDAQGEPNGAINEHVIEVLGGPWILTADLPLYMKHAGQIPAQLSSLGITSIQDAAVAPELQPLYDELFKQPSVPLRITLAQLLKPEHYRDQSGAVNFKALFADARATREKYRSIPNVKADALKLFVDGVLEGDPLASPPTLPNSAMLHDFHQPIYKLGDERLEIQGYVDLDSKACVQARAEQKAAADDTRVQAFIRDNGFHPSQCQRSRGALLADGAVVNEFVQRADKDGFAVHFHAIGDRAVRTAVDAVATVSDGKKPVNRHSISHLQLATDEDIARLSELKIPVAFTFAWAVKSPGYDMTVVPFIEKLASSEELYRKDSYYYRNVYPAGALMKAGGIVAAGSDAPVETDDPRPFLNIQRAVTRDAGAGAFNPDQGLSILDAIDSYTINGARLLNQQALTGSLEPGKKADFIVVDRDIVALAQKGQADRIGETRVLQTWFDGETVYRAE
ncbi:amidohydrolase [Microbulbifer taiwanensis]|uniref:amidohydrolase n=1 Tax=Microbulbifer taiwanensis TaxID=986746 RepID=UPI00360E1D0B